MKILITGCTATQVYSKLRAPKTKYVAIPKLIGDSLRKLGHQVEIRRVSINENIDDYDRVIVYLCAPNALITFGYWVNAMYTIMKRPDAILSFDDWQLSGFLTAMRSCVKNPDKRFFYSAGRIRPDVCLLSNAMKTKMIKKCKSWVDNQKFDHELLLYLFPWGDVTAYEKYGIRSTKEVHWVDPSMACDLPGLVQDYGVRRNTWLLGALAKHENEIQKLNLSWPVEQYGKENKILETELALKYRETTGSINFRYPHESGGWWRIRNLHAAQGLNIALVAHDSLLRNLHKSFDVTGSDVENMKLSTLYQCAKEQSQFTLLKVWSQRKLLSRLKKII